MTVWVMGEDHEDYVEGVFSSQQAANAYLTAKRAMGEAVDTFWIEEMPLDPTPLAEAGADFGAE